MLKFQVLIFLFLIFQFLLDGGVGMPDVPCIFMGNLSGYFFFRGRGGDCKKKPRYQELSASLILIFIVYFHSLILVAIK